MKTLLVVMVVLLAKCLTAQEGRVLKDPGGQRLAAALECFNGPSKIVIDPAHWVIDSYCNEASERETNFLVCP
jgi:hypothetical protein